MAANTVVVTNAVLERLRYLRGSVVPDDVKFEVTRIAYGLGCDDRCWCHFDSPDFSRPCPFRCSLVWLQPHASLCL